jgi:type VI secretion system secreted protein Hcp
MARTAFVTITGAKQGQIKGGVTLKGKEGSIALFALTSEIASPFDQASATASGKRQHHPIVITKPIDQATPKLYHALVSNEVLTDVTINFWRPSPGPAGGAEQQYFTIKLTNARIVDIRLISADTQDPAKAAEVPYEEVQFVYQKITWTWTDGGITAQDTWVSTT